MLKIILNFASSKRKNDDRINKIKRRKKLMKTIKVKIESNYTVDNVSPNNWEVNLKRYSNWAAIATLDENGDEKRQYLNESKDRDCHFQVKDVKKGDILAFGLFDTRKYKNSERGYYVVVDINDEVMTLGSEDGNKGYDTIRQAMKAA